MRRGVTRGAFHSFKKSVRGIVSEQRDFKGFMKDFYYKQKDFANCVRDFLRVKKCPCVVNKKGHCTFAEFL